MTTLQTAAQQALAFTMRDFATIRDFEAARAVLHDDLRAALRQEEEASAWLAERKKYWRKEKEKMNLRVALAQQDERDWSLLEATQESLREHMAEIHRLRAALAQQDEPVAVAERERIAAQWDGCVTHQLDTFGPVDIGASIRAGELVEPAQQVEPVATLTAQRDALLEALKYHQEQTRPIQKSIDAIQAAEENT
jgi:hypothetical protein